MKKWIPDNPLGLNESLLAMKSYAPFHHLFAVSVIFSEYSNMSDMVPKPSVCLQRLKEYNMLDKIINLTGKTLNRAFKNANSKYIAENKVFSPQNWVKNKQSMIAIVDALRVRIDSLDDDESNLGSDLQKCCKLSKIDFEFRWTAD